MLAAASSEDARACRVMEYGGRTVSVRSKLSGLRRQGGAKTNWQAPMVRTYPEYYISMVKE